METKSNNQEIDLLELLARFYGYLRQNWALTVFLPLIGAAVGLTLFWVTPYKIQAKMMVVSEVLTETECDYLLRQLALTQFSSPFTAESFGKKAKVKHSIKSDPVTRASYIEMTIQVQDSTFLKPAQKFILDFLENSENARRKVADLKTHHAQMIAEIDRELQSIEEVKKQFDSKMKAAFLNPSDLFRASMELQERKINLQIALKDIRAFRLVEGLYERGQKVKFPALLLGAIGFVGGCVVLMVVLFAKFFLGYYDEYKQTANA